MKYIVAINTSPERHGADLRKNSMSSRFSDAPHTRSGSCGDFFKINSQLHKIHKCQTNDSPVEYSCKISRQKTALTDT